MAASCGTVAGFDTHIRRDENPCPACEEAKATRTVYVRDYVRARHRALARLAERHRGEYAALLADERAKHQAQMDAA